MDEQWESRFERARPRLRSLAYRMLGSSAEADDALQDAWLRVLSTDTSGIDNPDGWLTTVVSRVCLNLLRARTSRREDLAGPHVPDPLIGPASGPGPEQQALLADSVGIAMMVVLETLSPVERVAFVLHDLFAVPFDEIAGLVGGSVEAARKSASRARRRVAEHGPTPDGTVQQQQQVVDAFFTAARQGDFAALMSVLHPDVLLRSDGGTARPQLTLTLRGARSVAEQAATTSRLAPFVRPIVVHGAAAALVAPHGRPQVVMAFTVVDGVIVAIDVLGDPERLRQLDLSGLD